MGAIYADKAFMTINGKTFELSGDLKLSKEKEREILFMPIEPIEERYSEQWLRWFTESFEKNNIPFETFGGTKTVKIKDGEFLDSAYTNIYKLEQAQEVCRYIDANRDKSFTVFCLDTWNPCLLNIAYMRDTLGLDIKIKSMIHAGVYDPHDYLSKKPNKFWKSQLERSLYFAHDEIFIATDFHRELFIKSHPLADKGKRFTKVDWPVAETKDRFKWEEKQDLVVFPHRLADEKRPDLFDELSERYSKTYPDDKLTFLKTVECCTNKDQYYSLLDEAKFAISFANQETFGIAMQEAVNRGCIPLVPNRLSYSEMYEDKFKFYFVDQLVDQLHHLYKNPEFSPLKYTEEIRWIRKI